MGNDGLYSLVEGFAEESGVAGEENPLLEEVFVERIDPAADFVLSYGFKKIRQSFHLLDPRSTSRGTHRPEPNWAYQNSA
jgi:hypothetical protein